jgi:hypothetical protein
VCVCVCVCVWYFDICPACMAKERYPPYQTNRRALAAHIVGRDGRNP